MRKVSNRTPRKTPPKQSSNSSPFKWQARKPTPPQPATPDTFMRRRMHFVLTHTPVLLRTRFRLINSQNHNSTLTGLTPKQPLLKKTRTKLIRKSASTLPSPSQKHSRSLVVIAKGVHYHQSRSGKSLRRISGSSPILPASSSAHRWPSNTRWKQGSLSSVWTASAHRVYQRQGAMKVSSTQWVANRVLRRTIQSKIQRGHKDLKSQPYCKFYNRYGRCHRGDKCPYIHDPEKVAVCTQFLRGTCKKTDGSCPFSHKASKDKMPVCVYFLKGVCNRDDCPYSHVKVSKKAEVCQEFLHGYCPRGAKCKNKHTLDCAEFNETGQCKLGNKCPLWHRKRKTKSEGRKGVKRRASEGEKVPSKRSNTREKHTSKSKQDTALVEDVYSKADDGDDIDTQKTDDESGSMPSFIALDSDSNQSTPDDSTSKKTSSLHFGGRPALKIRPLFAPSMGASTSHQGQCSSDSSSSSSSLLKPSVTTATGCSTEEQDAHP
ncbi:zinc finger CCCH domain-containing protein 3 [Strongylocentrotus purpuratus]|uniref:Zinc finger CCCH domain-containing protein 3 n=1 Tax=Strongylocentrotus purpuratus TaxID=7668 RepID=A0A7M7N490_STRPU|nr:zinc finger CCCH domain-containing protein 3 [Strongylocentrotus purpuratus]